jgi:hypothetical protein
MLISACGLMSEADGGDGLEAGAVIGSSEETHAAVSRDLQSEAHD